MNNQVLIPNKEAKETALVETLREACKKIAPVWPLENFVAVNPYLGLADQKFITAAQTLANVGGIQMTLPTSFYRNKIQEGKITRNDLEAALSKWPTENIHADAFFKKLESADDRDENTPVIAALIDVTTDVTKIDWRRFATSRVSIWAASYFDNGQASWATANRRLSLFSAWKAEAEVDLTPEVVGLKNFRKMVKALPNHPLEAAQKALDMLDLPQGGMSVYLHRLLVSMGGWSAYAARLDWDSELYGGKDGKLIEFLAVLICWEACVLQCLDSTELRKAWMVSREGLSNTNVQTKISAQLAEKLILQDAFDCATQRELISKFQISDSNLPKESVKPKAQAIFCIDVRSEVYRRNLELVDPDIETIGFAGFFAFPINFIPIAHDKGEAQCPVLIKTGPTILEEMPDQATHHRAYRGRVLDHQVRQLWKSFKSGAVTCFSFVSPLGLSFLPKLFTDSFGLTRPVPDPYKVGLKNAFSQNKSVSLAVATHNNVTVGIPMNQRIQMANSALNAMSLTENFSKFVLIVGHGSTTVNNPYATGLDCGACGGHTGESNARVAAAVLNDKDVRKHLKQENISIPESTVFLACLHDTTTDKISIFNEEDVSVLRTDALIDLKTSLEKAGHASRVERALRLSVNGPVDAAIKARSKDWSQVRPEWGLAGCAAFVVAPRERTRNIDFKGQTFLHSYEWKKDVEFSVLELIMTAPMVVTSWINLQYYASTVDNKHFGSGNKTLHNVTAGVGVLEGFSGDLRVGLPMQSVHDGVKYQHEPVRLNVLIEAPLDAMNTILQKHASVRNLCDNGWIYLLAVDEKGKVSHRYVGNFTWEAV